jgi:transcriptional regulator with XRE-family HTH domain
MNSVSKNIRRLRKRDDMSQEILAEKLNVTRQAISSWETGKTQPDIDTLVSISAVFKVDVTELIYGEKQNRDVYPKDRKKRLRVIWTFVAVAAVFILLEIFAVPHWTYLMHAYYKALPMWIYAFFFRPFFYMTVPLLFFSILSLRFDIRLTRAIYRQVLFYIGIFFVVVYYLGAINSFIGLIPSFFLTVHIFMPAAANPALFFIPGAALFFGLNK